MTDRTQDTTNAEFMMRVWEAYWQPEPHGTDEALKLVVALVLAEAAGVADDHAHTCRARLNGKFGPMSERDEGLYESALSEAESIGKAIRSLVKVAP